VIDHVLAPEARLKEEIVGERSNQQQHLYSLWAHASMQIKTQPQVLTFHISEAFFDLHTPLINATILLNSTRFASDCLSATTALAHDWRTAG